MTDEEKLYGAYYQPDRLWTGGKAIKELHKIMSMLTSGHGYQNKYFDRFIYLFQRKYLILTTI